jgi:anti-sigma-K factor RskA
MSENQEQTNQPAAQTFEEEVQAARISIHWGVAVAAAIAIVGLAGTTFLLRNQNEKLRSQFAEMETILLKNQEEFKEQQMKLEVVMGMARQLRVENINLLTTFNMLQAPGLKLMELTSDIKPEDPEKAPCRGRVFWDPEKSMWQVFAVGLDKLPEGKAYQLWFVNDKDEKVSAGSLPINEKGAGYVGIDIPEEAGKVVGAMITEEPAAGSEKPTGKVWLTGKSKP